MTAELIFTNPLGEVSGVEASYALLDGEGGTRFFTGTAGGLDTTDTHFPAANEQYRISVNTGKKLPPGIEKTTIGCSVLAIEEGTDIGRLKRATDADTCKVLGPDSSGKTQVQISVTSPYQETAKVQTWWALRGPGQVRYTTESKVVDLVGAGETFQITPDYNTKKPEWIGDGEVTCAVVGFWEHPR